MVLISITCLHQLQYCVIAFYHCLCLQISHLSTSSLLLLVLLLVSIFNFIVSTNVKNKTIIYIITLDKPAFQLMIVSEHLRRKKKEKEGTKCQLMLQFITGYTFYCCFARRQSSSFSFCCSLVGNLKDDTIPFSRIITFGFVLK